MSDTLQQEWWGQQFEAILEEIGRAAYVADVKILAPGAIEAIFRNDASVCGSNNPIAFRKLRELVMLGFMVRGKAFDKMGAYEADELFKAIRERMVAKFGGSDRLGGT
jgi:hypothetical protein